MLTINNRDKLDWHEGMTVQDVLDAMGYTYVLMTVTVNGTLIPRDEWATRSVPEDADIGVFHLAHGG
jgi:thiamine biosynthesis protein ThiS